MHQEAVWGTWINLSVDLDKSKTPRVFRYDHRFWHCREGLCDHSTRFRQKMHKNLHDELKGPHINTLAPKELFNISTNAEIASKPKSEKKP